MKALLKLTSACVLLSAALLFILKLDLGEDGEWTLVKVVDVAAPLVFGLALAALCYWSATRLGTPDRREDELNRLASALDATRHSLTELESRLRSVEALASRTSRAVADGLSRIGASSVASEALEQHDLAREREKIESLMSIARWDEAASAAERLVHDFPDRDEARVMLERVRRERTVYVEGLSERLFEQVKHASGRRQWRQALSSAKRLLEELPTHPRSAKVRATLDTLVANAEVEERQEREEEIQIMIRSQRLAEAIELSEKLIADYPDSPQARSLRALLPRLREHAGAT